MLLINEIYTAICGESRFSGRSCTLVRLTGCHIRCRWCDSAHSFAGGVSRSVADVVTAVRRNGLRTVLVTGGEPLLQREVVPLMEALLADGRDVLLETSGTVGPAGMVALADVPTGVHRVVDLKAPGSGISAAQIDWPAVATLADRDELKIVCADRRDYEWGRDLIRAGDRLPPAVRVSFSPVQDELPARDLAAWILADQVDAVLQIQLHKAIWPEAERGV